MRRSNTRGRSVTVCYKQQPYAVTSRSLISDVAKQPPETLNRRDWWMDKLCQEIVQHCNSAKMYPHCFLRDNIQSESLDTVCDSIFFFTLLMYGTTQPVDV